MALNPQFLIRRDAWDPAAILGTRFVSRMFFQWTLNEVMNLNRTDGPRSNKRKPKLQDGKMRGCQLTENEIMMIMLLCQPHISKQLTNEKILKKIPSLINTVFVNEVNNVWGPAFYEEDTNSIPMLKEDDVPAIERNSIEALIENANNGEDLQRGCLRFHPYQ